jgi:methylated-DNA-[protein]-cysteine S-methyltransferase
MTRYSIFATDAGWVGVAYTEQGLYRLVLPQESPLMVREDLLEDSQRDWIEDENNPYQEELTRYLAGERVVFDFPIDWSWATPFQRNALEVVRNIPYGKAESYGSVASLLGKPSASRAVGGALGRNKVPLVIPCHRVLASGGKLGGFSSRNGLKDKLLLLELEGIKYCR